MTSDTITFAERIKRAVWLLFILIVGYLLIASVFSTCYLGGYQSMDYSTGEYFVNSTHTFYVRDNYLQHILLFIVTSFILIKGQRITNEKINLPLVVCIIAGIAAMAIVWTGGYEPKSDPRKVLNAATALWHGDYTPLAKGEYLFRYPFQMGIILYFQILFVLFGETNYVAFQLVNAVWIAISYYLFVKIAGILWGKGRRNELGVSLLGLFFFPYLLFATLLYGTVAGMTFAMMSFYTLLLFDEKLEKGWLFLPISGFYIGIAALLKPNYVIFFIAEILYLLFSCFPIKTVGRKKIYRKLLSAFAIIVCFTVCRTGVNMYLTHLNHGEKVTGIPMIACAVMGLQENRDIGPGWFNGYHTSLYEANDYDYDKTEEAAIEDLKRIVSRYLHNPANTVGFFAKKTASQWNNPTFQSLLMLEGREGKGGMDWILHGNGRYLYICWANLLQTWILAGTFLYALFRFKMSHFRELLLPVTFTGGILAHVFCMEAQGLAAMVYYPVLIPLCICGYSEWRRWLLEKKDDIKENGWRSESGKILKKKAVCLTAVVVIVCALSYTWTFAKIFARNDDTGVFDTYTQDVVSEEEVLSK